MSGDGWGSGWDNQIVSQVIIVGAGGLLLVYSPTEAEGNLVASIASQSELDSFGNLYAAGVTTYKETSGGDFVLTSLQGGNIVVETATAAGGPYTAVGELTTLTTGGALSGNMRYIAAGSAIHELIGGQVLIAGTTGATPDTSAQLEVQGTAAVEGIEAIVSGAAETWHTVSIPATWTGSARVKILAESNFACFDCNITAPAAGASSGSFGTFPTAAYYPLSERVYAAGFTGAAAGTNARLLINVSATGPTFAGLPAGFTGSLQMTVIYPLD